MQAEVFDDTACELGEGPLWHPVRGEFLWFDILGQRLHHAAKGGSVVHQFDEYVSAAGWIDRDQLLVASETRLFTFDLATGAQEDVAPLQPDRPDTRSNDGRADPQGGFWIGTMGKAAEPGVGAIHRYFKGELRTLYPEITIPNGICFAPDGTRAYFCDTAQRQIMAQALDAAGWPKGDPEVLIDLRGEGLNPDGSVTDAAGNIWNAQWGASRVACYAPDGRFLRAVPFPARHTSCPAFGGDDFETLYCTTAREHLSAEVLTAEPQNGQTFRIDAGATGHAEAQVIL